MIDIQMASTTTPENSYPVWDFVYNDGIVPYVRGSDEERQRAEVSCFMQRGSVKQLPYSGPDWLSFLTDKISFGDLDSMMQESLTATESQDFFPVYSASNEKLLVTVQRRD